MANASPTGSTTAAVAPPDLASPAHSRLKISRITPIVFKSRYVIVRVETNEGITGIGECSPMDAVQVVAAIKHSLAPLAINQDPFRIESLVERLSVGTYKVEGRLQAMALCGIEMACWDIKGKALGVPLHQLLGGAYRDRVRMYATLDRDTPENMAGHAKRCIEAGFTAVKVKVSSRQGFDARPDTTLECARAVREVIGPERDMLMDANSAWSPPTAVRMCQALEQFNVWHMEQPVPERDLDALVYVNQRTTIPITFGEEDYSLWRYKDAIVRGACEVVQADPIKAPLLTCKKIAVLAEAFSKAVTPHNTSIHLGMAATLHLVASTPNARGPQECLLRPARRGDAAPIPDELLTEPFRLGEDGCLAVPQGPGLGVELNADVVERYGIEA